MPVGRRAILGAAGAGAIGAVVGGNTPALASGTSTGDTARAWSPANPPLDRSHATDGVATALLGLFEAKSRHDVEGTMDHYYRPRLTYTDATFGGFGDTWQGFHDFMQFLLPTLPADALSYPNRIVGDLRSAVVIFTNTPPFFGNEMRIMAAVDLIDGQVTRQVDYSDGRHSGTAERPSAPALPAQLGEQFIDATRPRVLTSTITTLRQRLNAADADGVAALFTPDGIFEDLALHLSVTGPIAIGRVLGAAIPLLPYTQGTGLRHVVGGVAGGAYEWTKTGAAVDRGIVAVELDRHGLIQRFTSVWDSTLVSEAGLHTLLAASIEH